MPCFDDKNLSASRAEPAQATLVYVWSPRMVLSAQHAASALRQAHQQGLAFVAVHDARVPGDELQAALARLASTPDAIWLPSVQALSASQSLCAATLIARDALRHFPTAFVVQASGLVHRHAIVGAMPEAAWAHSIALRLRSEAAP
ncbi:MAG: hypothetical protein WB821_02780 [Burkholderiaceae bacterium]